MDNKIGFIPGSARLVIATRVKIVYIKRDRTSNLKKYHWKEPFSNIPAITEVSIILKKFSETYFSLAKALIVDVPVTISVISLITGDFATFRILSVSLLGITAYLAIIIVKVKTNGITIAVLGTT